MINDSDFIFVTVGTPQNSNGAIDLSIIKKAISSLGSSIQGNKNKPVILVKSTVVPGTTQRYHEQYPHLKLANSPE